jgi:D-alanine-D-alanine ligase
VLAEPLSDGDARRVLRALEGELVSRGRDLALFLVYDRPQRVAERPGLARSFFAQRCVSDAQLDQTIAAFRSIGAYVELFEGERPFLAALAEGRLQRLDRSLQVAYNGIGWGIAFDGFMPGRKALVPAVADSYGLVCANSDAYACAFALHKFHYLTVLRAVGVQTPRVWHYRPVDGWVNGPPPYGTKVIAKSTYEAWSVGVTDDSIFSVDDSCDKRVSAIALDIGQPVVVQEFVSGTEVCVPILSCPERVITPPVETVLTKAPGDPDAVMTIDDNLNDGAVAYRRFRGPPELVERLGTDTREVFQLLQLEAFARVDYRVDATGVPWVTDVAISPGLSTASSAFCSLRELGFRHTSFLHAVIGATLGSHGMLGPSIATTRSPAS